MYKFIYKRKDDDEEDEDHSDRVTRDSITQKSTHAQGSMDDSHERNDSVALNKCSDNGTGSRKGALNSSFGSDGDNKISRKRPAVVLCESPSSMGDDGNLDGKNIGKTTKIPKLEKVLLQVKTARKSVSNVKIGGPAKPEFTRKHSSDENDIDMLRHEPRVDVREVRREENNNNGRTENGNQNDINETGGEGIAEKAKPDFTRKHASAENGIGMRRHEPRVDVREVRREEKSNNDSTENRNQNDSNEAGGEGIAENDNDKDSDIFLSKILAAYNNEFGNNPLSSNDSWDEVTERLKMLGWKYRCLSAKMSISLGGVNYVMVAPGCGISKKWMLNLHYYTMPQLRKFAQTHLNWSSNFDDAQKEQKEWDQKFNEMKACILEKGDINSIPLEHYLYPWVSKQRREYENMNAGKKSTMTEKRIKLLESKGFRWSLKNEVRHKKALKNQKRDKENHKVINAKNLNLPVKNEKECNGSAWEAMLQRFKDYRHVHGTPYVSTKVDQQLYRWVNTQRGDYHHKLQGRSSNLSDKQVQMLKEAGFVWKGVGRGAGRRSEFKSSTSLVGNDREAIDSSNKHFDERIEDREMDERNESIDSWNKHFDEWIEYREKHKSSDVKKTDNEALYKWVCRQRRLYEQEESESSTEFQNDLRKDKIEILEKADFPWKGPGKDDDVRKSSITSVRASTSYESNMEIKSTNRDSSPKKDTTTPPVPVQYDESNDYINMGIAKYIESTGGRWKLNLGKVKSVTVENDIRKFSVQFENDIVEILSEEEVKVMHKLFQNIHISCVLGTKGNGVYGNIDFCKNSKVLNGRNDDLLKLQKQVNDLERKNSEQFVEIGLLRSKLRSLEESSCRATENLRKEIERLRDLYQRSGSYC